MCNSVRYQGRWFQTPSELAGLVGGADRLVWQDGQPHEMGSCLCPVDLETTLSTAGFSWSRGVDPMEWFASRDPEKRAETNTTLEILRGRELSAVVFVRDYLQFQFDGPVVNAYVLPSILITAADSVLAQTRDYRNRLCERIGKTVTNVAEEPKQRLKIIFDDGVTLEISLREEDRAWPEAAGLWHEGRFVEIWR